MSFKRYMESIIEEFNEDCLSCGLITTALTDEQKAKLEKQKRIDEEKQKREFETTMMKFATMTSIVCGLSHGISNHDKYHGIYDEDGFPIMHK